MIVKKAPNDFVGLPGRRKVSTILSSHRIQKTIQFILIVVLLATSFAFLPQPAVAADQAAPAKGNGGAGTLTAQLNGRKITISGADFNKNREFIVNAKSGKGNTTKLGSVKSNNKGVFKTTFTLPNQFKMVKSLTVCVKDRQNGKRTCTTLK
jgi:hypothetical protein